MLYNVINVYIQHKSTDAHKYLQKINTGFALQYNILQFKEFNATFNRSASHLARGQLYFNSISQKQVSPPTASALPLILGSTWRHRRRRRRRCCCWCDARASSTLSESWKTRSRRFQATLRRRCRRRPLRWRRCPEWPPAAGLSQITFDAFFAIRRKPKSRFRRQKFWCLDIRAEGTGSNLQKIHQMGCYMAASKMKERLKDGTKIVLPMMNKMSQIQDQCCHWQVK